MDESIHESMWIGWIMSERLLVIFILIVLCLIFPHISAVGLDWNSIDILMRPMIKRHWATN